MPALVLFPCAPLAARITEFGCKANRNRARAAERGVGPEALSIRVRLAPCSECPGVRELPGRGRAFDPAKADQPDSDPDAWRGRRPSFKVAPVTSMRSQDRPGRKYKDRCHRGHDLTDLANRKGGKRNGDCRACHRIHVKAHRARVRAALRNPSLNG